MAIYQVLPDVHVMRLGNNSYLVGDVFRALYIVDVDDYGEVTQVKQLY